MKKKIKGMGILVALLVFMMGTVANAATYSDVTNPNHWSYKFIMDVSEKGLMQGYKDGSFKPSKNLTRAEVVTVLYNMAEEPDVSELTENFTDVDDDDWFSKYVKWASANGVVTGYQDKATGEYTFKGDNMITRQEFVVFIYRYETLVSGKAPTAKGSYKSFSDADNVADWASAAMDWAVGSSLVSGYKNNTLKPGGVITREECAKILSCYLCEHPEDYREKKLLYEEYVISADTLRESWNELKGIFESGDQIAVKKFFGEIPTCITCTECGEHLCKEGEAATSSMVKHMLKSIPSLLAGNGGCNRFKMYSDQCTWCGAVFEWADLIPAEEDLPVVE